MVFSTSVILPWKSYMIHLLPWIRWDFSSLSRGRLSYWSPSRWENSRARPRHQMPCILANSFSTALSFSSAVPLNEAKSSTVMTIATIRVRMRYPPMCRTTRLRGQGGRRTLYPESPQAGPDSRSESSGHTLSQEFLERRADGRVILRECHVAIAVADEDVLRARPVLPHPNGHQDLGGRKVLVRGAGREPPGSGESDVEVVV